MSAALDRVLVVAAGVHFALGIVALAALPFEAPPVLGVHPALKPMKFGFSIALFLATMAYVVPALAVDPALKRAIAWTLSLTMAVEMLAIVIQAVRGTSSHFNVTRPLDAALWRAMVFAIVIATFAMFVVAVLASLRPLLSARGEPWSALAATAWRAGLWLFLLAAFSGFSMGGRMQHSVGGVDGLEGMPLVNWSRTHGDLRVSHFFSMHALQTIPLCGALFTALPIGSTLRWSLLVATIAVHVLVSVGTLLQALAARPLV